MRKLGLLATLAVFVAVTVTTTGVVHAQTVAAPPLGSDDGYRDTIVKFVNSNPDIFSGIRVSTSDPSAFIIATPRSKTEVARTEIDAIVKESTLEFSVTFEVAGNSLAELHTAQDVITRAITNRESWALQIVQWGPTADGKLLIATPEQPSAAFSDALKSRLGVNVDLVYGTAGSTTGRQNDSSPFYGGGRIQYSSGGVTHFCTTGFGARKGTTSYVITAGHCGLATWTTPTGLTVGSVASRSYTNGGIDAEILNTSSTGAIFTGNATSSSSLVVSSTHQPVSGEPGYCMGGSFTGEQCGLTTVQVDQCTTLEPGISTCHLDKITNVNTPTQIVQGGDSGGPVYKAGSSVSAAGIIIGKSTSTAVAWYLPISYVTSAFGITVDGA